MQKYAPTMTYADRDTAEDECFHIHGISERKEQLDDIRKVGKHEIQIQEQGILVPRVLCGYSRKEYQGNQ